MDIPADLETSMDSLLEEVDNCLQRVFTRIAGHNPRNNVSADSLGDSFDGSIREIPSNANLSAESDASSDATIQMETDYSTHQPSPSRNVIQGPNPVAAIEEVDSQAVILPEVLPLPRPIPSSAEVIDLSDSLIPYIPSASMMVPRVRRPPDVIEISSDEESHPTPSVSSAIPSRSTTEPTLNSSFTVDLRTAPGATRNRRNRAAPQSIPSNATPGAYNEHIFNVEISFPALPWAIDRTRQRSQNSHGRNASAIRAAHAPPVPQHSGNFPQTIDASTRTTDASRAAANTSTSSGDGMQNETLSCPICYESLLNRKLLSTICGHIFCEQCLRSALRITKKCPICKRSITKPSHTHPVFLH